MTRIVTKAQAIILNSQSTIEELRQAAHILSSYVTEADSLMCEILDHGDFFDESIDLDDELSGYRVEEILCRLTGHP